MGIGHEKQCAMGWVTQNTFREGGVQQEVMENVTVQTPTGDMLVNQMRAGSLDAAVVYLSNTAGSGDFLDAVRIQGLEAAGRSPTRGAYLLALVFANMAGARAEVILGFSDHDAVITHVPGKIPGDAQQAGVCTIAAKQIGRCTWTGWPKQIGSRSWGSLSMIVPNQSTSESPNAWDCLGWMGRSTRIHYLRIRTYVEVRTLCLSLTRDSRGARLM